MTYPTETLWFKVCVCVYMSGRGLFPLCFCVSLGEYIIYFRIVSLILRLYKLLYCFIIYLGWAISPITYYIGFDRVTIARTLLTKMVFSLSCIWSKTKRHLRFYRTKLMDVLNLWRSILCICIHARDDARVVTVKEWRCGITVKKKSKQKKRRREKLSKRKPL